MSGPVNTGNSTIVIQPVGLPGKNGSSFTASATPPASNTGIFNDVHCNLSTGDMYRKEGSGWVKLPYKFEGASSYDLAVGQGYQGTLEEWLQSLVGAKGDRGDKTELRVNGGYIQWKYSEEPTWTNLIAVADLKGDKGDPGNDVELQMSATHIQWRVVGSSVWINLVPLSEITGPEGPSVELQKSATHIQWRVVGDTEWINLIPVEQLVGATGASIEMQTSATHIQWRVAGSVNWNDLITLEALRGPEGNISPELEQLRTDTRGYMERSESAVGAATGEADRAKDEADRAEAAAGALANSVTYDAQTKTEAEKTIARNNIGANDASNLNAGKVNPSVFDDTSHGERTGGLLHALATEALAGFMSPAFVKQLTEYADGGVVLSINGNGGAITLSAEDVGAVPLTGASTAYDIFGNKTASGASFIVGGTVSDSGVVMQASSLQSSFNIAADDGAGFSQFVMGSVYSSKAADKSGYQVQVTSVDSGVATQALFTMLASGNLDVAGTPTAGTHLTPKSYVDAAVGAKQGTDQKNQPNGYAGLDVDGLISAEQLPGIAITDIAVVSDEAAMLALDFQVGDLAIREDLSATFALQALPASVIGNWKELLSRTDGVLSVGITVPAGFTAGAPVTGTGNVSFGYAAGYQGYTTAEAQKLNGIQAGADKTSLENVSASIATAQYRNSVNTADDRLFVIDQPTGSLLRMSWSAVQTWIKGWIGKGDVGLSNVDNTSDASKPVSTATQTALDGKVGKSGNQNIAGELIVNNSARVRSSGTSHVRLEDAAGGEKAVLYVTAKGAELVIRVNENQSFLCKPDGTFHAPANVSITSDERLKRNIRPIRHAIDRVRKMKGYTYIKDGKRQFGFLAQELKEHFPEAVNENRGEDDMFLKAGEEFGTLSVNADNTIVSVLTQALNETLDRVDSLTKRIEELEKDNGAS